MATRAAEGEDQSGAKAVGDALQQRLAGWEARVQAEPHAVAAEFLGAEAALRVTCPPQQLAEVLLIGAKALHLADDADNTLRCACEAAAILRAGGPSRRLLAALNIQAMVESGKTRYAESIRIYEDALQCARTLGEPDVIGHLASSLGLDYGYLGEMDAALTLLQESLAAWQKAPDNPGRAFTLLNLAFVYGQLGRLQDNLDCLTEAETIFAGAGLIQPLITCIGNQVSILVRLGRTADAMDLAGNNLPLARSTGRHMRLAHFLEAYALACRHNGDIPAALAAWREAGAIYKEQDNLRGQSNVARELASLAEPASAERGAWLQEALAAARAAGIRLEEAGILQEISAWRRACGATTEALDAFSDAYAIEKSVLTGRAEQRAQSLRVLHQLEQARQQAEIERLRNVELHAALAESKEQSRQKSELLRFAAHDLRNMTNSILLSLQLLKDDLTKPLNPASAGELVNLAHAAANDLQSCLDCLLDAAVIEEGHMRIQLAVTSLDALCREEARVWQQAAAAKRQTLALQTNDHVPCRADVMRMREVIANLLSNAIKYAPHGSTIDIATRHANGCAVLTVRDRGPGIPEADHGKLFRPFQRLDAQPTGGERSLGLGLHIVATLVAMHHGKVSVETPTDGPGTVFRVELPEGQRND